MPWRGPEEPGEYPTLGYLVGEFIEASCAIPDGDYRGEPYLLTDEMWRFLLEFYRINPKTKRNKSGEWTLPFVYFRGAQLVRPQKWGKGPLSAAVVCAEAEGPVLFDGWDANGEPVGRPWATPWIQVTAASEDQTDNVWRALVPMIEESSLKADIPDTGETRINLAGGGKIEPVTAAHRSRLGQRITHAVQDESHSWWKANGGRKLADNQRRNLAGMNGRFMETSNAWDPTEASVAQDTAELDEPGVYRDDVDPPDELRFDNKKERAKILKIVYGDSWWVDLDRIEAECVALMKRDAAQAERFFGNRKQAQTGAPINLKKWGVCRDKGSTIVVPRRNLITVGVDGARFEDALGIVATDVELAHQWVLGVWEKPANAPDDYEHDFDEADGVMLEAFEMFDVWRVYIDPQYIDLLYDRWHGRWPNKIHKWYANRPTQAAWMVRNYIEAIHAGDLTIRDDEKERFTKHVKNARRRKVNVFDSQHRQMFTLAKEYPTSPLKMDLAMAGGISWEARRDAVAAGAKKRKRRKTSHGGVLV